MKSPMNVVMDSEGNFLVPARDEKVVYKFERDTWTRSVFAEIPDDGPAYIDFAPDGSLFVSVQRGYRIIAIAPDGTQKDIVGTGEKSDEYFEDEEGRPLFSPIRSCQGFDFDSNGALYFTDATYHIIRKLTPGEGGDYSAGTVEAVMGGVKGYADGKGLNVKFNEPDGILVYDDETLYVCDAQNCLIRKVQIR